MGGSCGSRWPGTEDPRIPTTGAAAAAVVEGGEEGQQGGMAAMDAEAEALPPVRDTEDAADPAAGAALVPEAGPATADPGPGPTPDQSLILPGTRRPLPSPHLVPDLDPGASPNPSQSLNPNPSPSPSPDPEAAPLPPKEGPGRCLKAHRRRRQKMEAKPRRAQHVSRSFQVKTSEHHVPDWIPREQQCPAVKGYYCVFHALLCFN